MASTLPAGVVTASLRMNTGGDQMSRVQVDVGVDLEVEFGARHFHQTIASCGDAGKGGEQIDTLGFSKPAYVDSILCDDRGIAVRLSGANIEAFEVVSGRVLSRIPIPPGAEVRSAWSPSDAAGVEPP